ncbi:MAG: hypothetical protein K5660_06150 [Paludibacteraceae bacterium]|nr:hypothetical protein [Paludibacteraceae bacterium]
MINLIFLRPKPHFYRALCLSLCLLANFPLSAQIKIRPQHFYVVSGSFGYSQFLTNQADVSVQGRPTGSLALGYELRHRHLWAHTGLEARYLSNHSRYSKAFDFSVYPVEDTQGKTITMRYNVRNYSETEKLLALQVPLLVGFVSDKGFYLGGGLRFGWTVFSGIDASLLYSTEGIYSQYDQAMGEMPNHSFGTYDATVHGTSRSHFICSFAFELGADIWRSSLYGSGRTGSQAVQLGVYADLGLNSPYYPNTSPEGQFLQPNPTNAQLLTTESLLTLQTDKTLCLPVHAGIKLTYLFQITTSRINCPTCP